MNGALSRSCGRIEKNFELSTTTTLSMTPVPSMDECINENYNPQCEVSAPGVTQTRDRILRDKTNVAHHGTAPSRCWLTLGPRKGARSTK
jgi:hypothetical protein